jgi:hypothetical protein
MPQHLRISVAFLGSLIIFGMVFSEGVQAGSLEPAASPAPTMKTLEQTSPTWDQILPADDGIVGGALDGCNSTRFTCVMNNEAVRDNETGLVWERSPSTTVQVWLQARFQCTDRVVNGRKGWRLPALHELMSLVDPAVVGTPKLSSGHPFDSAAVQSTLYWSGSSVTDSGTVAWTVGFDNGLAGHVTKVTSLFLWCIRGGGPLSEY